jgi:hypothetical protein
MAFSNMFSGGGTPYNYNSNVQVANSPMRVGAGQPGPWANGYVQSGQATSWGGALPSWNGSTTQGGSFVPTQQGSSSGGGQGMGAMGSIMGSITQYLDESAAASSRMKNAQFDRENVARQADERRKSVAYATERALWDAETDRRNRQQALMKNVAGLGASAAGNDRMKVYANTPSQNYIKDPGKAPDPDKYRNPELKLKNGKKPGG